MSNYPIKNNPTVSDQSLIWDVQSNSWKRSPFSDVFDLYNESFSNAVLEADSQYAAPSESDFNVTINANDHDTHLILTPSQTLAVGTITLPVAANLRDKQTLVCSCTQQVTDLTVDGQGATVNGAPTSLGADDFFTIKYDLTLTTWNRTA